MAIAPQSTCREINALDLPALSTLPSAGTLISTLNDLAIARSSFSGTDDVSDYDDARPVETGIPRYLTSIVSSSLSWLPSDDLREEVWELSSLRLSERAGRNAQPAASRVISIPRPEPYEPLSIIIHEPTLLSDNLGHTTWAAGYLLAKKIAASNPPSNSARVDTVGGGGLTQRRRRRTSSSSNSSSHSNDSSSDVSSTLADDRRLQKVVELGGEVGLKRASAASEPNGAETQPSQTLPKVLELGAGTGLAGLAFAYVFPAQVDLTDLSEIVPNLQKNVGLNTTAINRMHPYNEVRTFVVDWGEVPTPDGERDKESDEVNAKTQQSDEIKLLSETIRDMDMDVENSPQMSLGGPVRAGYDIILAADPLYSPEHPALLANAVCYYLSRDESATLNVAVALRDRHEGLLDVLRDELLERGLEQVFEREDEVWEGQEGDKRRVQCRWARWKWREVLSD